MPAGGRPPRVVLDTNVWVSGIFFGRGTPAHLLRAWRDGRFEIVVTAQLLSEMEDVLWRKVEQFRADSKLVTGWLTYIESYATLVKVKTRTKGASRDADDDMVLEAAVAGKAHFLVTGDKDLLVLEKFGDTQIVTPRSFVEHLGE